MWGMLISLLNQGFQELWLYKNPRGNPMINTYHLGMVIIAPINVVISLVDDPNTVFLDVFWPPSAVSYPLVI